MNEAKATQARKANAAAFGYITRHIDPPQHDDHVTRHDIVMAVLLNIEATDALIQMLIDPDGIHQNKVDAMVAREEGFVAGVKAGNEGWKYTELALESGGLGEVKVGDSIYAQTPAQVKAVNEFIENG